MKSQPHFKLAIFLPINNLLTLALSLFYIPSSIFWHTRGNFAYYEMWIGNFLRYEFSIRRADDEIKNHRTSCAHIYLIQSGPCRKSNEVGRLEPRLLRYIDTSSNQIKNDFIYSQFSLTPYREVLIFNLLQSMHKLWKKLNTFIFSTCLFHWLNHASSNLGNQYY